MLDVNDVKAGDLVSPAFSKSFKLLALCIVAFSASWMYQLWSVGKLAANNTLSPSNGLIWLLCGLALMVYTLISIYISKTTLTGDLESGGKLHQSWIWDKEVNLKEIAYAKLIRVKGFDWLIAPRLYVRTVMGKFTVFYAANPLLIEEYRKLVVVIQHRNMSDVLGLPAQ
jgi:hypothetical protein